ncbi:MAG: glycosyltransferase family A protein [Agriterribacter sp.]
MNPGFGNTKRSRKGKFKQILILMVEQIYKMIVLVPFRNVAYYIVDCVNSVLNQVYPNYDVYLLDDHSDDGTLGEVDDGVAHVHKIRNKSRLGAMENIFRALINIPLNDEDIVILLDGDDCILGEYAFQMVNAKYNDENILITYGQLITNGGAVWNFNPYSREEFENLRKARWQAPHLRTFKYKLFKQFLALDPEVKSFKNNDGCFLKSSADMALMFPLFEIAGYKRTFCFQNVLYYYRLHPNNDHAVPGGRALQLEAEQCIRNKSPFFTTEFL